MAMATVVAANILKGGGALLLSCFNRNRGGPRRPPSLLSTCSFSSSLSLSLSRTSNILKGGGVLRFPSYCTAAAAEAAVPLTSSSIPPPPVPEADAGEISSSSPSLDPIKEAAEMLDIRVGRILRAWRHEEADSLYVEEVDVGEAEPRIICSGLVNYIPLDHLQDKKVVVLANLKPRNMRGVKSCGMLMAASDASHDNVELLLPPEGSVPGERIWFGTEDDKENQPAAASPNQIQKKKIWELVQPHLKTDASCSAVLGMHFMRHLQVLWCADLSQMQIYPD